MTENNGREKCFSAYRETFEILRKYDSLPYAKTLESLKKTTETYNQHKTNLQTYEIVFHRSKLMSVVKSRGIAQEISDLLAETFSWDYKKSLKIELLNE